MQDLIDRARVCDQKTKDLMVLFNFTSKEAELAELQKKSEEPDLWNNNEKAQRVMKKLADLRSEVNEWLALQKLVQDSIELAEMDEESMRPELETETRANRRSACQKRIQRHAVR